jgi:hypothetical protein
MCYRVPYSPGIWVNDFALAPLATLVRLLHEAPGCEKMYLAVVGALDENLRGEGVFRLYKLDQEMRV